jgi:hypothetical protein
MSVGELNGLGESEERLDKRLGKLEERMKKLEKHSFEDTLTLVEILSSLTFFGGLKIEKCEYAKDGQCGFFFLQSDAKKKIPIATDCRIKDCQGEPGHCHLELSNVVCALCPKAIREQTLRRK